MGRLIVYKKLNDGPVYLSSKSGYSTDVYNKNLAKIVQRGHLKAKVI